MCQEVVRIANRHIARCLSQIGEVHEMPELCSAAIRREMHFCAQDVADAAEKEAGSKEYERITSVNRR